jgi:hypothetical protein
MAAETSPTTYANRRRADTTTSVPARHRGPKPAVSDDALLAAIRADLARSPWHGEGHRKIWARLRVMDGIRVARKRVLRLMRENALLSPHRARTRDHTPHDRQIITEAPNLMWATDATQIITVQDGRSGCSASPSTGTPKRSAGTSPSAAIATLPSKPSVWRSGKSLATSVPALPVAWRCDTTMAARSSPNTSTIRSAFGA